MNKTVYILLLASIFPLFKAYASGENPDTVRLEEMVVTAVKQSGLLSELPTASTFVSAADTRRLGITTLRGVSDLVPNFYIPQYGSSITSSIYVRGIGARMDQPSVGLSVDNVGFLNKDAYDFDVFDIQSVQVLRGPQSTLYGRNTIAGQVNITTLSAFDFQGWRFAATLCSGFDAKVNAGFYRLFSPVSGLALVASYKYDGGSFANLYNGSKTGRINAASARAKYDWRPSENFRLQNTLSSSYTAQSGYPYESVESGLIAYNDTCFYRRFCLNDALTVRWHRGDIMHTSLTSFQYIDDNLTLDQDFLPLSYFTLTQKKREPAITQDFVIRSPSDRKYAWTFGIYGLYRHLDMQAPVTFLDDGIANLIEANRNDQNPDYPIAWTSRTFPLHSFFKQNTFGLSAYHQSDLRVGEWSFSAGLRLDYEHQSLRYNSVCNTSYDIFHANPDGSLDFFKAVPVDIDDVGSLSHSFLQLLPKITAMYKFSSADNVYLSLAKGYKAGGFNTQMFSDILQQRLMSVMGIASSYDVDEVVSYKPEYSYNVELGAHLSMFGKRLALQPTLFYIDCRDQQLTMFPPGTVTGRIMTNAGRVRSYGFELQAGLRDVGVLDFNASYGYTNAKFVKFHNGKEDFKGKRVPYAPESTLFLQTLCNLPLPSSAKLVLDLNLRGAGPIYWNEGNTLKQNFYALLNASATLSRGDWSVQLWIDNITDTKYYTFYFQSIGNSFVQRGDKTRCGITFRINI